MKNKALELFKSAHSHASTAYRIATSGHLAKSVILPECRDYTEKDRERAENEILSIRRGRELYCLWIEGIKEALRNSRFTMYQY